MCEMVGVFIFTHVDAILFHRYRFYHHIIEEKDNLEKKKVRETYMRRGRKFVATDSSFDFFFLFLSGGSTPHHKVSFPNKAPTR